MHESGQGGLRCRSTAPPLPSHSPPPPPTTLRPAVLPRARWRREEPQISRPLFCKSRISRPAWARRRRWGCCPQATTPLWLELGGGERKAAARGWALRGENSTGRGRKVSAPRAMPPVEEVDITAVPYKSPALQSPHLTGFALRAFLWLMESRLLGPLITSVLKSQNNMPQMLQQTVIPERPMYFPEYPPQGF